MKNEFWKLVTIVLALILVTLISRNFLEREHQEEVIHNTVTDTVWVMRFKEVEPFKTVEIPKIVFWYSIDTVKVKEIVHDLNHIQVIFENNQALNYSTQFLAQYPNSNKLVQFYVHNRKLELTKFTPDGQLITDRYNFRPEYYDYRYVNNNLTTKPKGFFNKFGLSASTMIRPVSRLYDFNLGITHKTSISIIELGINLHYYPILQNNFGVDPYLQLRYEF